ncbi:MAG: phosphoribosyltransferase [Flavobacteriales bacterium CG_4_9_14_3_um_filter_40_17]|nr:MAG: phosphoribosyltransferase [Flavobacteriales bacterium CG_4_9_14_3_um_filter_40_17]
MPPITKTVILDAVTLRYKIRRIAFQIYESNIDEQEIVLAGIEKNGFVFAERLVIQLNQIAPLKVLLCRVVVDKKHPLNPIQASISPEEYQNKSLVLVDDVLNSGSTLMYAVKYFLKVPLKQFKTAVLINRNHKKFPVKADFKGVSLSTSLQEHVEVDFRKEEVYLE